VDDRRGRVRISRFKFVAYGLRAGKLGRSGAALVVPVRRDFDLVLGHGGYTPPIFCKSGEVVGNEWVANLPKMGVNKVFGMK
jgi:hypothetical protein